jgi:hypothetical protein
MKENRGARIEGRVRLDARRIRFLRKNTSPLVGEVAAERRVGGWRSLRFAVALTLFAFRSSASADVDYTRDVRPILSQHCFKCHGPDDAARKAKLRLDLANPIVAIKDDNELLRRIHAEDESEIMPPPSTKNPLSAKQKEILRQWIAEGAQYKTHWSFLPPKPVSPPAIKNREWVRTPIDAFILSKLEAAGLSPSPEADRHTLARRVSLDLVGLPPTPAELDAFINDQSPDAYERFVDRLLASPRYGERWARRWLDLARYADTNGYEKDRVRSIWPYRDWVIAALNADKPYDQFSIEQLAGDMLPKAGMAERVATGFHRNTMINEEGGVDPLEFRYHAVADRVGVTANVWLGLTFQCAQCHTHKFDPITHRDYFGMFAYFDQAEEPVMDVPTKEQTRKRKEIEDEIQRRTDKLIDSFVIDEGVTWREAKPVTFRSTSGVGVTFLPDGSLLLKPNGKPAVGDDYLITVLGDKESVDAIRLETLVDDSLPSRGPGLTPHGNFVVTEVSATSNRKAINLLAPTADVTQREFSPAATLDKNNKTGWAVHVGDKLNSNHHLDFQLQQPLPAGSPISVRIEQRYGGGHVIGRFRVMLGKKRAAGPMTAEQRRKLIDEGFQGWLAKESKRAAFWGILDARKASASTPHLITQRDGSILSEGDVAKSDTYSLQFNVESFVKLQKNPITGLRLEALTDKRLPGNGPGRVYYEGPIGDFFLSEFTVSADGKPVKIKSATADYSSGKDTPMRSLDGDQQTGWSISGAQGKDHRAVFVFEQPVMAKTLDVVMLFERYYAAPLGRFRISATTAPNPTASSHDWLNEVMLASEAWRDEKELFKQYLSQAPETATARAEIDKLRASIPKPATTLVMQPRDLAPPRVTNRRHRGEYLQPREAVTAATPSALQKPKSSPTDRLSFAKWLVGNENPLGDRVAVNRQWSAFFGRGLVRTAEDFGSQGETPSHPELLDWLAIEFRRNGMSMKRLHRLIVTSAVYRQSTKATAELLAKDAENVLLGRFPNVRLEAEMLRDAMLAASGLLSQKMNGPSVFPPQPPGVSSEGAYGPLAWNESKGEDRYRRGLYTFSKRTAPYAMFATFDAPSGEACVVRREVSNTPLQALTAMNDRTVMEAAQTLGRSVAAEKEDSRTTALKLFVRVLSRLPTEQETVKLVSFFEIQKKRFEKGELDAKKLSGGEKMNSPTIAAWTAVARAVLNLHEAVVKP